MKKTWLNHLNNLYNKNCFENIFICGEFDCELWFSTNNSKLRKIKVESEKGEIFYLKEQQIIKNLLNKDIDYKNDIFINNEKYYLIKKRENNSIIYLRKRNGGAIIIKTKFLIVIGTYIDKNKNFYNHYLPNYYWENYQNNMKKLFF